MRALTLPKLLFPLLVTGCCFAGGGHTLIGQSEQYQIKIDFDAFAIIEISKFIPKDFEYKLVSAEYKYKSECKEIVAEGHVIEFTCRPDGKTIMAGTTYKLTNDATPRCPGDGIGYRFTCVKGCKSVVPMYIAIEPYEC